MKRMKKETGGEKEKKRNKDEEILGVS